MTATNREAAEVLTRYVNHLTGNVAKVFPPERYAPLDATEQADVERALAALGVPLERVQADLFRAFVMSLAVEVSDSVMEAGL